MKHLCIIAVCFLFVAAPCFVFASSVVINEVMFNPVGDDTGGEWVELYNANDEHVDISGWELYPDGIGYMTFPSGSSIGAKQFMLVHLRLSGNDSATDLYQQDASSNMSNTSGSVALFSAEPRGKDTIKSFVQWGRAGETWESSAADAGLWDRDTFIDINSFAEGNSLSLAQDGMAHNGKDAWLISIAPTPKTENIEISVLNSPTPSPSATFSSSPTPSVEASPESASASVTTPGTFSIKTIKAFAGEDISSVVGVMLYFLGRAKGFNDESLDATARFFWNFGDGETKEGRSVAHSYRVPGSYVVGLHVSSGEYAASDYMHITVSPNLVGISRVVLGQDGYLELINGSDIEVDVSGWNIRDNAGHIFTLPPHTMLGRRAHAAITNNVTTLLSATSSLPLTVFYPNGAVAFSYSYVDTFSARVEASSAPIPRIAQTKEKDPSPYPMPTAVSSFLPALAFVTPVSPLASSSNREELEHALASSSSFGFSFGAAVGISILGAAGFLISKRFF